MGGRRVYLRDPSADKVFQVGSHQAVLHEFLLVEVENDARARAAEFRVRRAADLGKIERQRHLVQNAPLLKGTRIATTAVWNLHRAGYDAAAIIREFPCLTSKDVQAAIRFEKNRQKRTA